MRRFAHIASIALITAGLLVVVDVGITLAYQEPLSSIYSSIKQSEKASQLKNLESEFLTETETKEIRQASEQATQQQNPEALHQDFARLGERLVNESKPGDALGRIEAPDMNGLNMVFVQGTDEASLDISGSGEVDLLTHPTKLNSDISGSGRIVESTPTAATAQPPASPAQRQPK